METDSSLRWIDPVDPVGRYSLRSIVAATAGRATVTTTA